MRIQECSPLLCCAMLALLSGVRGGQTRVSDYTITPSTQVAHYHYPAPAQPALLSQPQPQQQQPRPYHYQPPAPNLPTISLPVQSRAFHQPAAQVTKQFASPVLDNVAFAQALNSQNYAYGASSASPSAAASATKTHSVNVKLPVPLGITPINIAPLPLQAGAPYASLQRAITSYGTPYPPQRR